VIRRFLLNALLFGLGFALIAGLVVVAAGLRGRVSPMLDLANLVIVPAAALAGLAALALLWRARGWWRKAPLAAAIGLCVFAAWPPRDAPDQCLAGSPDLRIAWINVGDRGDPAAIAAWLLREDPAIVGFGEVDMQQRELRATMAQHYPHLQSCQQHERCSTLIYARSEPEQSAGLARGDAENRRALSGARMQFALAGDVPLEVIALHLSHPWPDTGKQNDELLAASLAIEHSQDAVVIGDFNLTRRMHKLRRFAEGTGLVAASADRPTWPLEYAGRDTPALIQIDHLLVGRNWAVRDIRTSDDLGSDHRGFVADLCRRG
jgi:endonuclease/exonuclease/phosphatase (EEP) superfamily protein YafD